MNPYNSFWRSGLLLLTFCFAACASTPPATERDVLQRDEAARRAAIVKDIRYDLQLDVSAAKSDIFSGTIKANFRVSETQTPLWLDFGAGQVTQLVINGRAMAYKHNGRRIALPGLSRGENNVEVSFTHPYSRDGAGLYRFQDPEDGATYLNTDLEPFSAHDVFPVFDQPDLKAVFALTVKAPADWKVISSAKEISVTVDSDINRRWLFKPTLPISPYVFAVIAGPFAEFQDQPGASEIPLRLFVRRSLARYLDAADWFNLTRQGLKFYGEYFDRPYPFEKYDQILVPDFNTEAMENVGAVTFAESNVFRGKPSRIELAGRADTILHELAHMWFGNLVTLRWWDDLWLNESFATEMAARASEAAGFTEAREVFHVEMKNWGYWEDAHDTRHPIATSVPATDAAFATFDGISYGKGAAVLHQLAFAIGEEHFRDGVRAFLAEHAFANATSADLIQALSKAAGTDLSGWTREWLQTSGTNTVRPDYTCRDGRITAFALVQSALPDYPTLRSHRTKLSLYSQQSGSLSQITTTTVTYAGPRTEVPDLGGKACPDLVQPNVGDYDFALFEPDVRTLKSLTADFPQHIDPLSRHVFWDGLWQALKSGHLRPADFLTVAQASLPREDNLSVAEMIAVRAAGNGGQANCAIRFLAKAQERAKASAAIENLFFTLFRRAPAGSDAQKFWFDTTVIRATQPATVALLKSVLAGTDAQTSFIPDPDRRWSAIIRLNALGDFSGASLVAAESKRDHSHFGLRATIAAAATRPDPKVKEIFWQRILHPKEQSLDEIRAAANNLFPAGQESLQEPFAERYFTDLATVLDQSDSYLGTVVETLYPAFCRTLDADRTKAFLNAHPKLSSVAEKKLRFLREEELLCLTIRQKARPR